MPAANAIMGDDNFGTDLPQSKIDESEMVEVHAMANYAKGKEFQRIKAFLETRMDYYTQFLPDGRDVRTLRPQEAMEMWPICNAIIGELKYILGTYEAAKETATRVR